MTIYYFASEVSMDKIQVQRLIIAYEHIKEKYLQECKVLADDLIHSINSMKSDSILGCPMTSSCVTSISERYGALSELHEVIEMVNPNYFKR